MKSGVRALGVAESYRADTSTLAGAVVRADRVVDGFVFGQCTVGASDATASVIEMIERVDRPDVRYVMLAGIAPAWYNVLDLWRINEAVERPVLSVSFEDSDGLESALRAAFDGEALAERLATYRDQPERRAVELDGEAVYVRAVGCSDGEAERVIRAFTPEGGRPEPLRVAREAARAVETVRRES
ncbi:DUF99 family protein [Halapricum desulfuricans]|uniref:UPF0215 protein HSEST_2699 n=1 Tax=Halapricum desulfuricans TaxID=2841257 RepID=A0A897NTR3_9EURY|nr:DUF99 family protein [Halapricum desulfuricans]QSG16208.1 Endonuclease V-like protein [Halapricum desulfuricans]